MTAVNDLRLLAEMAEEIEQTGYTGLPGGLGLRRLLTTQNGKLVGKSLENIAGKLLGEKDQHARNVAKLQRVIDGLRSELDQATASIAETIRANDGPSLKGET